MSAHPLFFVGNLDPSITETITDDAGVAVNLTGKTVKFKMRAVGATTAKVDAAAVVVSAAAGTVRYDWTALDVDTAGWYLVWWEVTTTAGGHKQDMGEALIEFGTHAPQNAYVELEIFKSTAELTATSFADQDIQLALVAASRGLDLALGRRFYPDLDANQIRYYTPGSPNWLTVDDLITLTALATDPNGNATFTDAWTLNTDFVLEPLNAVADGWPYQSIRKQPRATLLFPYYPRSVRVTGKFGWAAAPTAVKEATTLIAARLVKRTREAPFGIVSFGLDGAAVRAASMARDPEIAFLVGPYSRNSGIA
jgi:hypothetical protein